MNLLSMLIQCERDQTKYLQYVREISELMGIKAMRLAEAAPKAPDLSGKPEMP